MGASGGSSSSPSPDELEQPWIDPPAPPVAYECKLPGERDENAPASRGGGESRFRVGDLVEVQEGYALQGARKWYTGFVAYVWFDDSSEPWTGYAIQFIQSEKDEDGGGVEEDDGVEEPARAVGADKARQPSAKPPRAGHFERRVAAKRVRRCGGTPAAADAELATDRLVLGAAYSAAMRVKEQVGKKKSVVVYSNVGRVMRSSAVQAQSKFEF